MGENLPRPNEGLLPGRRSGVVTLLFTDVVDSTALKQSLGDRAGVEFLQQHRQLVRSVLSGFPGAEELSVSGDSFLLTFPTPSDGVTFALQLQTALRSFNRDRPVRAEDRIGLHLGEVRLEETAGGKRDVHGIQVDTCARVLSLAQAGQILMTRPVFDNARQSLKGEELEGIGNLNWLNHGRFELKGVEEPVEICEVRAAHTANLSPPTTSEKARRVESMEGESVLGWRPAVGSVVPNTKWMLERKLGEGGFGEVWLGQHQVMKERRVFKFCFRADRVRSLKREMTLFRLIKERIGDHPNIVSLREVYFDQPPFYVEEDYVEGEDLASWCATQGGAGKVPQETRLEIIAQIADALQAAHDAGVIHRDVKPGNILVASAKSEGRGSRSEDPELSTHNPQLLVKLTDFGIGQVVSEDYLSGITKAGFTQTLLSSTSTSHTGTQMYMAPELLAGKPASTRSDIYSLGVVLYQLLVGDFKRPLTTDWAKDIPEPLLQEDLHCCFAGDPERRFAGAALLAKNLRGLPERRKDRAAQLAAERHSARRRLLTRVSLAGALGLLLLAGALGYGLRRAQKEALNARRIAYSSDMNLAWRALKDQNLGEVRASLKAHIPKPGELDLRGWEWRYLWQASRGDQLWTLGPLPGAVRGLAWLPDGRLVASSKGASGVTIWDGQKKELLASAHLPNEVSGLAVSGDGSLIAVADWRSVVRLLSTEPLRVTAELAHETGIIGVAFSPDGKLLSCRGSKELVVWTVPTRTRLWATNGVPDSHSAAPFSRDGASVFCEMRGGYVGIFNATNGELVGSQVEPSTGFASLAMTKDGTRLAAGDWVGSIILMDPVKRGTASLTNRSGPAFAVAFSPDGTKLAAGSTAGVVTVWDLDSSAECNAFRGHGKEVLSLLYSQDGKTLWSGSKDGTVRAWNVGEAQQPGPPLLPAGAIPFALTRMGRFAVSYYLDPIRVSLFDLQSFREGPHIPLSTNYMMGMTSWGICHCGREAAVGLPSGKLALWKDGKPAERELEAGSNAVTAIEFAPGCSRLATASETEVRIWDWPGFRQVLSYRADDLKEMAFAADGSRLAVAASGVHVFSLRGQPDLHFSPGDYCPSVAFSKDGSLVAGGFNGEVRVWDLNSRRLLHRLEAGIGDFRSVGFSPDGKRLLACDGTGTTCLWDLETGRDVARFEPRGIVGAAHFQEDGNTLVLLRGSVGTGFKVELLKAAPWDAIRRVEDREKEGGTR